VKEKLPNFVFLIETKVRSRRLEEIRIKLGFEGLMTVDPQGLSGGLALFWRHANEVQILNYSRWHISAIVTSSRSDHSWKFTGFYGNPDHSQ
jgi:hypothetical protein